MQLFLILFISLSGIYLLRKFSYFINKDLIVFNNVEYGFVDFSNVTASAAAGTNYNVANQLNFSLGIKLGF
jgi:hypothetical protein